VPLVDEADGRPLPRVNVSTKLTSLYPGFDPIAWTACKTRAKDILRPIAREAVKGGVHIHLDMEHYAIKDLTLDAWEELFIEPEFRDYPHVGIVLQAYLKDGDKDVCRIIDYAKRRGTPIWVRLVKGAYWDSETVWAAQRHWPVPVWEQKWQSDACYERMTRALLENYQHTHAAFASHNVRSLCHAIACREALGVPGWAFELQMLFGMGDPIKHAAIQMGQRCRIYTPYGNMLAGMAYLIRRLLENTANESFLRQSGDDDADIEKLIENPLLTGEHTTPPATPVVIRYEFEEPVMESFENAANTDFGLHDARRKMQEALAAERAKMGRELALIIGGEPVTTGQWFETLNPSKPSEIVARVAIADQSTVDRAVAAAVRAAGEWRRVTPHQRSAALERIAEVLEARRFELSALQSLEVGKTWREADADVSEAIDYCRYYAREMRRITTHRRRRDIEGETNEHYYMPRGVTAALSPFNFPLSLLVNMASAALVTGNPIVIKPANPAAATAARFVDVCREAELPAGVVNLVAGPGESVGEMLVKHADIATIAFTGSRAAGLRINKLAAETVTGRPSIKRVVLELGAKNAIIVDADADLDEAIKGVLASAFSYAGQKCSAASRVILLDSMHDRFMERFIEAARSKGIGPADEATTSIPPLVDKRQFDAVRAAIEAGKREAKCVLAVDVGDLVRSTGGYYVGPHIFDDVPAKSRLIQDEILGPIVCIQRACDFEHAVELFNGSDYALTGGLYSRSPANIERARDACECGVLYINRPITGSRVDLQPFGGLKLSGGGPKIGGPDYLLQYCESRTVTENTLRRGFAPSEEVAEALA
jgi:RHH-type proline utilization regulon transcriptional repressor/proline dehydrogenase/delta 1-pyrroline-5-carboxylate dehydrogenase